MTEAISNMASRLTAMFGVPIEIRDRLPKRPRQFVWDPERGSLLFEASTRDNSIIHEVGHFLVANKKARKWPEFGLGTFDDTSRRCRIMVADRQLIERQVEHITPLIAWALWLQGAPETDDVDRLLFQEIKDTVYLPRFGLPPTLCRQPGWRHLRDTFLQHRFALHDVLDVYWQQAWVLSVSRMHRELDDAEIAYRQDALATARADVEAKRKELSPLWAANSSFAPTATP